MKNRLQMQSRKLALIVTFFLCSAALVAQDITITGTIVEGTTGSTLVGVTVVQKGTTKGTVSDLDGNFKITVSTGSTLVFSYVGYEMKELIVIESGILNVALEEMISTLDELIVIGYGTQKKTDKTGAVSLVKSNELNSGVITDPIQALQGKAAGVSISKKGGDPNEGFSVRIRGASGFAANTQPLYVIDGIPNADPTMISPTDIESYNVLKDAASTAIYGSQGSNGVIIITTKKGQSGEKVSKDGTYSNIEFTSQFSFENITKKLKVLSAAEMRAFADKLLAKARISHPEYNMEDVFIDGGATTDWQDEIYRTGYSTTNSLSISGGNAKNNYLGAINHSNWDGVMRGTSKERTTARLTINQKGLNDRLTFTGFIMGAVENNDLENYDGWDKDDIIYQAISRNPTDPVYNPDGTYYKSSRVFNYENPTAIINEITNSRYERKFLGGLKTDLEVLPGLVGSVNIGYTYEDKASNYFRPANLFASADNGYSKKQFDDNSKKLIELTGNYIKSFNNVHNINLLLGYSWQQDNWNGFYAQARDAQSPFSGPENIATLGDVNWGDIGSWRGQSTLIGFFGRGQYNFKSKYYLSASLRYDGSSKFGSEHKWGWFPTVAVGWSIDKEKFMESVKWLDQLKLRASYGVSGNDKIGNYRSLVMYEPSGKSPNPETGQMVLTFKPSWNANPFLKWEQTSEINIGLDFAIIRQRVSGSIEVYSKKTIDLLGEYAVSVPPNLAERTFANSGSLENKGIELYLQVFLLDYKNFDWKTSFTAAHNKTKILDLGSFFNDPIRKEGYVSGRGIVGAEYYTTGIMVGEETGSFYLPTYVTLLNGVFIYNSKTGGFTDSLKDAKRSIIATAAPKIELGWSNSFTVFKRWNLDFSFRAWIGNHMYNATQMFFDNPGILPSLNAVPEALEEYDKGRITSAALADKYVENASFVKLDYISLSYNFNVSKVKWLNKFSLYVSANNVLTITGYSGIDPETRIEGLAFGIDQFNVYPKTRAYTFGLKVNF